MTVPAPVRIKYDTLRNDPGSLKAAISEGLGSQAGALGIVIIEDLPKEYPDLRANLLKRAAVLASLPEEDKKTLESPETTYSFGWSHGKEVMNGKADTAKGSYYANPLKDKPEGDDAKRAAHPEYYAGNVWPSGIPALEGFEAAFKDLGRFVADVGIALAHACDEVGFTPGIAPLISKSQCSKARLLHYFPSPPGDAADDACGTHIDHSLLTGLCSAMYLDPASGEFKVVQPPSPNAGLWIYPRGSKDPIKVAIPADCLAFQTGEALELISDGQLAATPHYVSGGSGSDNISRETFAFFLQPDVDDVVGVKNGETFGQFSKRVLQRHYAEGGGGM